MQAVGRNAGGGKIFTETFNLDTEDGEKYTIKVASGSGIMLKKVLEKILEIKNVEVESPTVPTVVPDDASGNALDASGNALDASGNLLVGDPLGNNVAVGNNAGNPDDQGGVPGGKKNKSKRRKHLKKRMTKKKHRKSSKKGKKRKSKSKKA